MTTEDPLVALRRQFPALSPALTYFNSAYTTLVPEPVLTTARDAAVARWSRSVADLERARERVAAVLETSPDAITFVPGTTQALAVVAARLKLSPYARVVASAAEHRANREPWGRSRLELARLEPDGCVRWAELEARLAGAKVLAIAHASNVTGEIAPLERLIAAARREGAFVVVDAAQSAPHLTLNPDVLGPDVMVFSGHKAWGLGGVGVLWARPEAADRLGLDRSRVEDGLPHEAIAALPVALETLAASRTPELDAHRAALASHLDAGLRALPDVRVLGPADPARRIPLFGLGGGGRSVIRLAEAMREAGVVTRAGMHLAEPLHAAVGLDGTLRISAHTYNTIAEADRLITTLHEAWRA